MQRAISDEQRAPFYNEPTFTCYATTVRLPESTRPENWSLSSVFDTTIYGRRYYRMMERRDDGTIRMVRASRVEQAEISPDRARRDNGRLGDFDNSKATINFDPNTTSSAEKLTSVPATYEVDWTSPGVSCLP